MADKSTPKKPRKSLAMRQLVDVLGIPGVFLMAPLIQACITIIGGGSGFIVWYLLRQLSYLAFVPIVFREFLDFTYMPAIAVLIGLGCAYAYGTALYLELAGQAVYWFYTHEEVDQGYSWYWRYK